MTDAAPTGRATGLGRGLDRARRVAASLGALVVLQLALAMYFWLPELDGRRMVAPTWELLGLVALALGAGLRPWPRWARRGALIGATTLVVVALLLGFGQGFARREFGYDVELALDLEYVPALVGTMWRTDSAGWFVVHLATIVVALTGSVALVVLALRRLARVAAEPRRRGFLAGGLAAYAVIGGLALGLNGPLVAEAAAQLDFALNRQARLRELARTLEHERAGRVELALGARRPDLVFLVVESYGAAVFDKPELAALRGFVEDEGQALIAAGYTIRSRYLTSPVFGGSSWMADATMLCGVPIKNQRRYASLYATELTCLPGLLARFGYRSILAAANTTFVDDKFARLFPFDRLYLRDDFGYAGPRYAWSYVPDQFVINAIDQREISAPREQPLFAFLMLTSSHHPWRKVPLYLERWEELGDGRIFEVIPSESFANNFVTGSAHVAGFAASTRYALTSVFDYLARLPATATPLVVVIGDHQPRKPVGNMKTDPWWVPVHVMSRDPALVERFAALGYVPGVVPDAAGGAPGLDRVLDHLAYALADDDAHAAAGAP